MTILVSAYPFVFGCITGWGLYLAVKGHRRGDRASYTIVAMLFCLLLSMFTFNGMLNNMLVKRVETIEKTMPKKTPPPAISGVEAP